MRIAAMTTTTMTHRTSGGAAAWAVLIAMGGTSVTFQVWHAVHAVGMPLALALLFAGSPVTAAMGLSHIVAVHRSGWLMKTITIAVMVGAMSLSAGAIAAVVAPVAMHLSWLFGAVLDAAALVALAAVLTERDRRATAESQARAIAESRDRAEAEARATLGQEAAAQAPAPPAEQPRPASRQAVAADRDPEAEKARRAYRKSVRDGVPMSDRALGAMFDRSRTWGASRIREAEDGPHAVAAAR